MFDAGKDIGPYRISEPVARGRSGAVYRAHDHNGRAVALKMHDDADAATTEIDCLKRIDHQGVVNVIEHAQLPNGGAWLTLPWIEGQTLGHLMEVTGPLPLDRTRRIVSQLADALDAIHSAGFVHGDLAPSNVLIDGNDTVTIIDLATSTRTADQQQLIEQPALDRTTGIQLETTPRYAAPEIATGRAPEPASDIYALALITYELLTGTSPFPDVATPIAMLGHHASSTPDAPTEHRPDLPGAVEDAILAGLAKEPTARPKSASQLAQLLHDDGPGSPSSRGGADRSTSSARLPRIAALATVACVIALGLFALTSGVSDEPAGHARPERNELAAQLALAAGDAAGTLCNLASNTGFEGDSVPDHFYLGDATNTAAVVEGGGVDDSSALRVGANGAFGIFGEIIPVDGEGTYVLSAWLRTQGAPDVTTMYVDYLDADFELLTDLRAVALTGEQFGTVEGQRALLFTEAPAGAAFAVPTFFKDGSGGSLLVDEIIFGAEDACLGEVGS